MRLSDTLIALWRHRSIWGLPLGCKVLLLIGATQMAINFDHIVSRQNERIFWSPVVIAGVVYFLGKWEVECRELFLPRQMGLLGVGPLLLICFYLLADLFLFESTVFHQADSKWRLVVALPLVLFVLRVWLVIGGTRFSPTLEDMMERRSSGDTLPDEVIRRFRYWLK